MLQNNALTYWYNDVGMRWYRIPHEYGVKDGLVEPIVLWTGDKHQQVFFQQLMKQSLLG